MVKITFRPYEELIIHDIVMLDSRELIERHALVIQSGESSPLYWANKILFSYTGMEHTDDIVREQLDNKIHWINVTFAICEKYRSEIRSSGNVPVPIFNVSNDKILNNVTEWLYKKATSPKPPFSTS